MKSLLLTLFVLMATLPASARQVLALDSEKVYAENQAALEDIEVVRTSLTPKNVELFLNPVTVYNNQCVEYRDGVVCGYDSFRCGGNGHGYSQYCCWNARICSKWENVPSKSFASVTLKFGKSLPLAAGQEDHILLTPIQFERDRVQASVLSSVQPYTVTYGGFFPWQKNNVYFSQAGGEQFDAE